MVPIVAIRLRRPWIGGPLLGPPPQPAHWLASVTTAWQASTTSAWQATNTTATAWTVRVGV